MGFLNDVKKLLFGVKSVTKSAAEKTLDKTKDIGEDILDKGEDALDAVKDVAEDVGEKISSKAEDIWEKAVESASTTKQKIEDSDLMEKAKDISSSIKDKVEDAGETISQKVKDISDRPDVQQAKENITEGAQKVNATLNETGHKLMDKLEDAAESISEKASNLKEDLFHKAKEKAGDIDEEITRISEKAEELKAKEASEPEYKDMPDQFYKSEMEGKDDFFAKAEAFAEGDYSGESLSNKPKIQRVELPQEEEQPSAADPLPGFEDEDGDGSEIIDDAEVISEEE